MSMKTETKSLLFFAILGIIAGALSFYIQNSLLAIALASVLFAISKFPLDSLLKEKRKYNWYFSNGGALYFFVWFIVWIILFNL